MAKKPLIYLGAPCEVGACFKGAGNAPSVLRELGLVEQLEKAGFSIEDAGDLEGPVFLGKNMQTSLHFLEDNFVWAQKIYQGVREGYLKNRLPILVGGDHAISIGSILAAREFAEKECKPLHVLWFDAHGDFNTPETSPTGHIHGMPLAVVCGRGHPSLLNLNSFSEPIVREENVTLVGARDIDKGERVLLEQSKISHVSMSQIKTEGLLSFVEKSLKKADDEGAHLHVSFDVDVVDDKEISAVGTPVPDGIKIDELSKSFEIIKKSGLMSSLDVVELNPDLDSENEDAYKVKDLVLDLFI